MKFFSILFLVVVLNKTFLSGRNLRSQNSLDAPPIDIEKMTRDMLPEGLNSTGFENLTKGKRNSEANHSHGMRKLVHELNSLIDRFIEADKHNEYDDGVNLGDEVGMRLEKISNKLESTYNLLTKHKQMLGNSSSLSGGLSQSPVVNIPDFAFHNITVIINKESGENAGLVNNKSNSSGNYNAINFKPPLEPDNNNKNYSGSQKSAVETGSGPLIYDFNSPSQYTNKKAQDLNISTDAGAEKSAPKSTVSVAAAGSSNITSDGLDHDKFFNITGGGLLANFAHSGLNASLKNQSDAGQNRGSSPSNDDSQRQKIEFAFDNPSNSQNQSTQSTPVTNPQPPPPTTNLSSASESTLKDARSSSPSLSTETNSTDNKSTEIMDEWKSVLGKTNLQDNENTLRRDFRAQQQKSKEVRGKFFESPVIKNKYSDTSSSTSMNSVLAEVEDGENKAMAEPSDNAEAPHAESSPYNVNTENGGVEFGMQMKNYEGSKAPSEKASNFPTYGSSLMFDPTRLNSNGIYSMPSMNSLVAPQQNQYANAPYETSFAMDNSAVNSLQYQNLQPQNQFSASMQYQTPFDSSNNDKSQAYNNMWQGQSLQKSFGLLNYDPKFSYENFGASKYGSQDFQNLDPNSSVTYFEDDSKSVIAEAEDVTGSSEGKTKIVKRKNKV